MNPRVVADVGGTNVRFAIADAHGQIDRVRRCRVADFASFADALSHYRADVGAIAGCAIAAAGPVVDDAVRLTNNDWTIERDAVAALLGGAPVALLNDLEAVAAALPRLTPDDFSAIGTPSPQRPEHRTMLAVNVGTGFGAACVMRRDGRWFTGPSEAGHMTLGACDAAETAALAGLPAHASVESVLSGAGLVGLYHRLAGHGGDAAGDAADVLASHGRDAAAAQTVALFTTILGRIAGDLALATCAWGGVYLTGSVALAWSATADIACFRRAFVRKGLMLPQMQQVATAVVRQDDVALHGLATVPLKR